MFDGKWRTSFERACSPSERTSAAPASPPTTSPPSALLMRRRRRDRDRRGRSPRSAFSCSSSPRCPTCSTARSPRHPAPRRPAARSSTRSATECTDALLLGGVAWYLATVNGGHIGDAARWPCSRCRMLISYERAKAESLGFDARGGIMERAERIIAPRLRSAVRLVARPRAVGDARPHDGHGGAAVREGVAAGERGTSRPRAVALAVPPGRPSHRQGAEAGRAPSQRQALITVA